MYRIQLVMVKNNGAVHSMKYMIQENNKFIVQRCENLKIGTNSGSSKKEFNYLQNLAF